MGKFIWGTPAYNADGTMWNPASDGPVWYRFEELSSGLQVELLSCGRDPDSINRTIESGLASGRIVQTDAEAWPAQSKGEASN